MYIDFEIKSSGLFVLRRRVVRVEGERKKLKGHIREPSEE